LIEDIGRKAVDEDPASNGMDSIHRLLIHMLTELERVSEEHGLRYFLTYGSLIGAVRDGRVIDWDVDVDVLVPVSEYHAMCTTLSAELPQDLILYSPESVPGFEHTFARIGYRGIDHKLLRLDLIPLGSGPEGKLSRLAYAVVVRALNLFYMLKLVPLDEKIHYGLRKRTITRLAKIPLALVPSQGLLWAINRIRTMQFAGTTLADSCGWFGPRRQFFDAAWFESSTKVELEGQLFNAPIGTAPFLEWVYGDYMNPISVEGQERELKFAHRHYVTPLRDLGVIAG
jgi:lipopolysaccharide cholinephosphotransferase